MFHRHDTHWNAWGASTYASLVVDAVEPGARILVVSDSYHLLRSKLVFRKHFQHVAAAGVPGPVLERSRMALREVPAIAWYALRGRFQVI